MSDQYGGRWQDRPDGEPEAKRAFWLLVVAGVLAILAGLLIVAVLGRGGSNSSASPLLVPLGVVSAAIGVLQLVVAFLVRRRREVGRKAGMALGMLGLGFATFDIVSLLLVSAQLTTVAQPLVRVAINVSLLVNLYRAAPWFAAAPLDTQPQPPAARSPW